MLTSRNTLIGLVLLTFGQMAWAEANSWVFDIPTTSTGTFTASESVNGVDITGTYIRQANGFIQMTVTDATGPNSPNDGTVKYAIEAPGFALFSQPFLINETKMISSAASGACPANAWTGIMLFYIWSGTSGTITDVSLASTPAYGVFTWNPLAVPTTSTISNLRNLTSHATLSGFASFNNDGTCNNGVISFSGAGDRGGTMYVSAANGGVFMTNTKRAIFVVPQTTIPSASVLNGNYSAWVADDSAWQNLWGARFTISGGTTLSGDERTDLEADTANTSKTWSITGITINSPVNGMFTGNLSLEGGSTSNVACAAYLRDDTTIFCTARNPSDGQRPLNFAMVSDSQAFGSGTIDSYSFGTSGKVTTTLGSSTDTAYALALQSDGRIIAAGTTGSDYAIARYQATGALDTTWGTSGRLVSNVVSGANDFGRALAITSVGKVIVTGYTGTTGDWVTSRYTTHGILDTTWGTNGIMRTSFGSGTDEKAYAIALDSSERAVVFGMAPNGTRDGWAMARYTTRGILDTTFGTAGKRMHSFATRDSQAYGVTIQSDGKIVACGAVIPSGTAVRVGVARYHTNGTTDTSFGTSGTMVSSLASGNQQWWGCTLQPNQKIVAVGQAIISSNTSWMVARYNSTGILDSTFGTSGRTITSVGTSNESAQAVGIDANSKIVVAGYSSSGSNNFAVGRYLTHGILDTAFGTSGIFSASFGSSSDIAYGLAIQSDGKYVLGGVASGSSSDFGLMRVWP